MTPFERAARETLRERERQCLDNEDVRRLVSLLRQTDAEADAEAEAAPKPRRYAWSGLASWSCAFWVAVLALLLLAPVLIAASVTQEIRTDDTGVLRTAGGAAPAGAAMGTTYHDLKELTTLPEATLRRIRDCAFAHRGVAFRLRVASLVRNASGVVRVAAADGSKLMLQPNVSLNESADGAPRPAGSAQLFRPFVGEEPLDLSAELPDLVWRRGCSFSILAVAPPRARLLK